MSSIIKVLEIEYLQRTSRSILRDLDALSVKKKLEELFRCYDPINYALGYDWPIWRARKCSSPEGYGNLSQLSHPLRHLARPGRLNNQGEPVLYVSFNKFTTFTEVAADEGDHVHIVGYKLKNGEKIRCCIVGEIFNVHRSGRAKVSECLGTELNKILNQMPPDAARSFVFLDAFLSSILADQAASSTDYLHSRILGQLLFEKMPDIQAICYSSIALEGGMNLAVKPEVAQESFEVAGSTVVRINKKYDYGIYDFSVVRNALRYGHDGTIVWDI
jgi:hypothetical protein